MDERQAVPDQMRWRYAETTGGDAQLGDGEAGG